MRLANIQQVGGSRSGIEFEDVIDSHIEYARLDVDDRSVPLEYTESRTALLTVLPVGFCPARSTNAHIPPERVIARHLDAPEKLRP